MTKTITAAQLAAIFKANEEMKGTAEYCRYHMEYQYKHNGKWMFGGWGVPYEYQADLPVKTYKDNKYIMVDSEHRYTLTEVVEELIKDI